jgi:hypothetical protein
MTRRKSEFIAEDYSITRTILVVTEKQRSLYIKKKQSQGERWAAEVTFHCKISCKSHAWTCNPWEHLSSQANHKQVHALSL